MAFKCIKPDFRKSKKKEGSPFEITKFNFYSFFKVVGFINLDRYLKTD